MGEVAARHIRFSFIPRVRGCAEAPSGIELDTVSVHEGYKLAEKNTFKVCWEMTCIRAFDENSVWQKGGYYGSKTWYEK